jgi:hypothetical protein
LRLLLDEHFPRRVAVELRSRGFDVVAVTERDDLRGIPDAELFAAARRDRRAIVTQDFADFSSLLREGAVSETDHFGVIFVPKSLWSSIRDLDTLVEALDRFLDARPADDALAGGAAWLEA